MAKRRGRPGNGGKRKPCGRLRARAVLVDYGNQRAQAMRAAFAMFRGGRAGNELGDPIGKAWAAGLLDGFGADPVAMRDAGRDFGQLWRQCYGELHSTIVGGRSFEKREGLCSCQGFHLPESGAPIPPQGAESIGGGKLLKGGNGNPGAVA